jgi:exo-beta-1,3-glucanase (GH17 family)
VRIYGVDCNQIRTVHSAASTKGIKLFAGLLTITNVAADLASMIQQLNGHFDSTITTISIGNELVDMGRASAADVVAALTLARGILSEAGYTGSVVTVDTFNALIAHPELCRASDYCAANAHSYFDGTIEPAGAGAWVQKQVQRIGDAAGGGKKVVITESGWPHGGNANGVAVPSPENQAKAMQSIRDAFGKDLFLFCAFDDKWKADGAWGVEKFWGIM